MLAMIWPYTKQPPPSRWVTHKDISDTEVRAVVEWIDTLGPDDCGPSSDNRQPSELTNTELWECIVSGSREATDQIIRAVLH